jgi:proteic killer suppression protein
MVRSFKHRGLKRLFERNDRSGIRPDLVDTVQEVLTVLDDAATPQDLNLPGYRLHPLKGGLKGFWSVTIRATGASFFALKKPTPLTLN